jgi:hypothetical protein
MVRVLGAHRVNESAAISAGGPLVSGAVDERWKQACGNPGALIGVGGIEPKAPPEHRSERTESRERGVDDRNGRIGQSEGDQSRRRMTPINFPWMRTLG